MANIFAILSKRPTAAAVLIGTLVVLHVIIVPVVANNDDAADDTEEEVSGHLINVVAAPRPDKPHGVAPQSEDSPLWTKYGAPAMRRAVFDEPPPSCLNRYGPMCGDCNTLWSCVGAAEPVLRQNCEETHPGQPLCERNACTAKVSNQSSCATQLRCTGQGYFPNPSNCQQYYFCAGAGGQSLVYECPPGYAYNANTTRCRRNNNQSDDGTTCVELNCNENANRYVEYPGDRQLYAFCLRRLGVLQPVMLRCPGNAHRFNATEQRCVFECPAEGRFADYTDQLAYYECLPTGDGAWIVQHQRCLPGFRFVWWRQQCESDASIDWDRQTFNERTTGTPAATTSERTTATQAYSTTYEPTTEPQTTTEQAYSTTSERTTVPQTTTERTTGTDFWYTTSASTLS